MTPALSLVLNALADSLPVAVGALEELHYTPGDDAALLNNLIRREVRERLKPMFESLATGDMNMSPIHFEVGPYEVRLIHARDGGVPPAGSEARKEYYATNDAPTLVLNVFPPDGIIAMENDVVAINEYALLVLWDSEGDRLTQFSLCRPFTAQTHEMLHLLAISTVDSDTRDLEQIERREGVDDREDRTGTDDGDGQDK